VADIFTASATKRLHITLLHAPRVHLEAGQCMFDGASVDGVEVDEEIEGTVYQFQRV